MSLIIPVMKPLEAIHKLWRWTAVSGLLLLVLSGCALNRMYEVKQQFCDFDGNFSYSLGEQPQFVFHRPLILARDVKQMLGHEPTEIEAPDRGRWLQSDSRDPIEKVQTRSW